MARFEERVIISSSSSPSDAAPPTRAYSVESESSSFPTENGEPSTSDGKLSRTGTASSSRSSPASASRNSWTITGTFIVLAAWKRRLAPIRIESGRTSDR